MAKTLEDRIRERAYILWANSGGSGDGNHFWMMAEREVLAEIEIETLPALPTTAAETAAAETDSAAPTTAIEEAATTAATDTPAATAAKAKKTAARKSRSSAKSSAKPARKPPVLAVVESTPAKSATITPLRPAAKTSAKPAATKARARAAAR